MLSHSEGKGWSKTASAVMQRAGAAQSKAMHWGALQRPALFLLSSFIPAFSIVHSHLGRGAAGLRAERRDP